jgi:hypothetical protein
MPIIKKQAEILRLSLLAWDQKTEYAKQRESPLYESYTV